MTELDPGLNITLGFIGGGQMAEALIKGILSKGLIPKEQIKVSDPEPARRQILQSSFGIEVFEDNKEVLTSCQVVVLAVKPQVMCKVLKQISSDVTRDHLLVSIAAGITLRTLEHGLPPGSRVIRVMPNTPALVQQGASALCLGSHVGPGDAEVVRAILQAVGTVVMVGDESLMDAVTGLSGSGPAYVFSFIAGLIDAGVREGLSRPVARDLVVQTVLGAAALCKETAKDPSELTAMVTSPGGTTIEGLYALEKGGLRGILMDAVKSATLRSKELGK